MSSSIQSVIIRADASANWKIAGLRQLDRLVRALNEFAAQTAPASQLPIAVEWLPDIPLANRWIPNLSRLPYLQLRERLESGAAILPTQLVVQRNGMAAYFARENAFSHESPPPWRILNGQSEIAEAEEQLLRHGGKSQDGFVSRYLNRPVSRAVTRLLLRTPMTPNGWTLTILILPVLSCAFLWRGSYANILLGVFCYHLHSVLDGCDGEIARAKYLESSAGRRIDDWCDIGSSVAFSVFLGLGLARGAPTNSGRIFAFEGIICAALIVFTESILRLQKLAPAFADDSLSASLYPRHQRAIRDSGLLIFGERLTLFLVQLTKRDVGIAFFVVLALLDLSPWILHLWTAVTTVSLTLALRALAAQRD